MGAMMGLFEWLTIAAVIVVVLGALRILVAPRGERYRRDDADEARLIQEIHQGLQRLEERVEALETILMDKVDRTHAGAGLNR